MAGRRLVLRAAVLSLALAAAPGPAGAGLGGMADALFGGELARVTRTAHGVVHVDARSEEALGFGIGYAYAQDNVCAVADLLVTLRGERSRWFGAESSGELGLRTLPNRVIDFFVRSHFDDVRIAQGWAGASAGAQARMLGVVEGFDHYLDDEGAFLPPACAGKPWVQPMTVAELRRAGELLAIQGGLAAWADAVVAAQPPSAEGVPARPDWLPTPPVDNAATGTRAPRPGGIALAFGRDGSDTGHGLLLAAPHGPWQGLDRQWQVHLTLPGQVDAMGAITGPLPWLATGFNQAVAWARTASAGRRFTLHELQLVPGHPTSYLVDGRPEAMRAHPLRVSERGPDAGFQTSQRVLYESRYGPIVVAPTLGLNWTPATAYALQDVNAYAGRRADTWRGVERAANVGELRDALSRLGTAGTGTVAADRGGFVLYADTSGVPDAAEPRRQGCGPSRAAVLAASQAGLVVLDGSRSACDLTRDPAAPVPGAIAPRRMPQMLRTDWVGDAGSGHWLANPMSPLTGYPPLVGPEGVAQGLDARQMLREVTLRTEQHDAHVARKRMSADQLSAILFWHRSHAADLVLPDLLAACRDAPTEATRAACDVLARWDRSDDVRSRGAAVFREFWRRAKDLPGLWRVPFDRDDPVGTPSGLNLGPKPEQQALRAALFDALGQGVHAIREAGYSLDLPLGIMQHRDTAAGAVAFGGGEASEGLLDVVGTGGITAFDRSGYAIDQGASYLQLVSFDADGPGARGLLAYGQSSQPGSPWYFDQFADWAAARWLPLPFRAEDVAAQRVGDVLALRFRSGLSEDGRAAAAAPPPMR